MGLFQEETHASVIFVIQTSPGLYWVLRLEALEHGVDETRELAHLRARRRLADRLARDDDQAANAVRRG